MKFWQPLVIFPGIKLILQLMALRGYGVFRDELYYIACSERLAAGYVDHPPFSIWILKWVRAVFGEGIEPMRIAAALVSTATVFLVGAIARKMGGDKVAQALAMTAYLAAPMHWFIGHFYSMNVFDNFFWALTAYLVLEALRRQDPKAWAMLGLVLGLGLLNKISVLWLGFGLGAGLVLTRERRQLKTVGPWLAAGLSGLVFLPHLLWQIRFDFPTLEFIANATGNKMAAVSPMGFILGPVEAVGGTLGAIFVVIGVVTLFIDPFGRGLRVLGWMYVAVFLLLMVNGASRSGYLAPAYAWVMAAAGVGIEFAMVRITGWARVAAVSGIMLPLAVRGALALPFTLPILPVDDYIAHAERLGVVPSTEERKELAALPQHYADMFGWKEKIEAAQEAYFELPEADRNVACLVAFNYGVAGALENERLVTGDEPVLPPVISGHNNYWLWGPGECTGEVLIMMGGNREDLAEVFGSVEEAGTVECGHCMPYENHQPVWVARDPKHTMAEAWPSLKHYD